jgi:hypothetical protein
MMLSTPACHAPFTPAPQYADNFANVSAPRDGSFNKYDSVKDLCISIYTNAKIIVITIILFFFLSESALVSAQYKTSNGK